MLHSIGPWTGIHIYEAEYCGEFIQSHDKVFVRNAYDRVVVREARLVRELNWSEKTHCPLACDCADRVLHLYEKYHPDDNSVGDVINTSRKVANGFSFFGNNV